MKNLISGYIITNFYKNRLLKGAYDITDLSNIS